MNGRLGGEGEDLRELTNRQLAEKVIRQDNATPMEIELALRLEAFLEIHGDYLTEV